jgi:hypothetical protein
MAASLWADIAFWLIVIGTILGAYAILAPWDGGVIEPP